MSEAQIQDSMQRAAQARARLAEDLNAMLKTGENLVEDGKRAVKKSLPVVVGVGLVGLLVASVVMLTRKSRPRRPLIQVQQRSFLKDAFRSAMLSLIGVVATRLAQRLPLPLPPAASERRT